MTDAILLRTHRFGARDAAFLARLAGETGWQACVLADETRAPVDTGAWPKISFTPARIAALGLHRTADMAWRCGDYGFYLARAQFPAVGRFWMIEPDVRAATDNYGDIFARLARLDGDFMAPGLAPAERAHYWYPTMRWHSAPVYRCHFAFCAMSARAADLCLAARRGLARDWRARIMWPNDETFVTTTLHGLGCRMADCNDAGALMSTPESFGFLHPIAGEVFEALPRDGLLYHPVLWDDAYRAKASRVARGVPFTERVRLKLLRGIARAWHRPAPC